MSSQNSGKPFNVQLFVRTEDDEVTIQAVRLQQLVCFLFFLSFLTMIFNLSYSIYSGYFYYIWWPFMYWLLLATGFVGATTRSVGLILCYIVGSVIILCLSVVFIILYIVAIVSIAACSIGSCTYLPQGTKGAALVISILTIVVTLFYFCLLSYSLSLANKLRKRLETLNLTVIENPPASYTVQTGTPVYYQPPLYQTSGPAPFNAPYPTSQPQQPQPWNPSQVYTTTGEIQTEPNTTTGTVNPDAQPQTQPTPSTKTVQ